MPPADYDHNTIVMKLAVWLVYSRGQDERGEGAYIGHQAMLLEELLAGDPPKLA